MRDNVTSPSTYRLAKAFLQKKVIFMKLLKVLGQVQGGHMVWRCCAGAARAAGKRVPNGMSFAKAGEKVCRWEILSMPEES